MDTQAYQPQTNLFKALNHPVRLAILDILRMDEACVCHMEAVLGQRQAYISQQLAVLRDAGIISDRRDGWNIYYQVSDPKVFDLIDLSNQFLAGEGAIEQPELSPKNCPCPKCNLE
jgi:ArsR family transcriptional regulator